MATYDPYGRQAKELARLRAEVEALRKDAQRYQYIKNKRGGIGWMLDTWEDFDLDAAIDHSLRGEEEEAT